MSAMATSQSPNNLFVGDGVLANRKTRLGFLYDMMRIRAIEEGIADRYSQKEMRCPVHLSIGQEGVAVGVCAALESRDYMMSTHRAHAHYLAKGGSLKALLAEIYGKATGCACGKGGSMHLVDLQVNMLGSTPIVGSSLPVAVGTAFGTWQRGGKEVTVIFFGEGTTEEGVFLESLNFAALKKLPVLFVCENNLYSVYSPMSVRQGPERDRVALAKAHGILATSGDGNDVEEVYAITCEALHHVRRGEGPSFVELETYRWREHCGPAYDNHIGYRTEAEFLMWKERCPVASFQRRLLQEGVITQETLSNMRQKIQDELENAFSYARSSPPPNKEELSTNLYA